MGPTSKGRGREGKGGERRGKPLLAGPFFQKLTMALVLQTFYFTCNHGLMGSMEKYAL